MYQCKHLDQIKSGVQPKTPDACEECLAEGKPWTELRLCLTCGHVGCCDSSMGRHSTAHFKSTGHAIMESYKSRRSFRWCFIDEMPVEVEPEPEPVHA
jgi:monovalent cation/hydrogen antiporter